MAGYIFVHETYDDAAKRRLIQELGIVGAPLDFVGKTSMEDEGCEKFIGVFATTYAGQIKFDHTHIDAVEFIDLNNIRALQTDGGFRFTPTFLRVLDFFESRI